MYLQVAKAQADKKENYEVITVLFKGLGSGWHTNHLPLPNKGNIVSQRICNNLTNVSDLDSQVVCTLGFSIIFTCLMICRS